MQNIIYYIKVISIYLKYLEFKIIDQFPDKKY